MKNNSKNETMVTQASEVEGTEEVSVKSLISKAVAFVVASKPEGAKTTETGYAVPTIAKYLISEFPGATVKMITDALTLAIQGNEESEPVLFYHGEETITGKRIGRSALLYSQPKLEKITLKFNDDTKKAYQATAEAARKARDDRAQKSNAAFAASKERAGSSMVLSATDKLLKARGFKV